MEEEEEEEEETSVGMDELSKMCDDLLVRGLGLKEISVNARERRAEDESREIAKRETDVRTRKRQLRELYDQDEDSTSEKEDERREELHEMERELESLGDGVRVPDARPVSELLANRGREIVTASVDVVEPSTDATHSYMWEPIFSERVLSVQEKRADFIAIYPGEIDKRHAVMKALMRSTTMHPSPTLRVRVDLARNSLMLLTRATEDDLLRTPKLGERPCRQEYTCQGYKNHGYITRECLVVAELDEYERSGTLPAERRPCLNCMRYDVTWFWMYARLRGDGIGENFISTHYNLSNMRGEYLQSQMLLSATFGLPLPVVPFVPGALEPQEEIDNGEKIVRFVQKGMISLDRDEDFP